MGLAVLDKQKKIGNYEQLLSGGCSGEMFGDVSNFSRLFLSKFLEILLHELIEIENTYSS